jgi:hypothetical protein
MSDKSDYPGRVVVITGWQGGVFNFLHRLMPNAVELLMAKNTEMAQLKDPPPAPKTTGAAHRPSETVSGS